MLVQKRRQKGLRVSNFTLLKVVFKWYGSQGVKQVYTTVYWHQGQTCWAKASQFWQEVAIGQHTRTHDQVADGSPCCLDAVGWSQNVNFAENKNTDLGESGLNYQAHYVNTSILTTGLLLKSIIHSAHNKKWSHKTKKGQSSFYQ